MTDIEVPDWFQGKTVAVVGNAMSLFEQRYGAEIDAHDVVVRFNRAAGLWDRADVRDTHGTRTDVWSVWWPKMYQRQMVGYTGRVLHVGPDHHESSTADYVLPKSLYSSAGLALRLPSSGLLVLKLLTLCDPRQVDVYGFDFKKTPSYEHKNRIVTFPHNFDIEEEIIRNTVFSRPEFQQR